MTSPCSHGTFLHRHFGPALAVPRTPLLPAPAFLPPHRSSRSLQPCSSSSASAPQLLPMPGPGSSLPAPPSTPNLTDPSPGPSAPFCAHRVPGPATMATHPRALPGSGALAAHWCQTHCAPQHPLSMQHPGPLGAPTLCCCTPHPASSLGTLDKHALGKSLPFQQDFPRTPQPAGGCCHSPAAWQGPTCHAPSGHRSRVPWGRSQ